mmetsp:Transcript_37734/g.86018  ORF Transcript_37734/g.86018 Transcript_37734/m.86018 type:complete len:334 (-) Transcript_37734:1227-2228(-)
MLPGATHATTVDDTNWAPAPPSTSSVPKRHRSPASRKPDPVTLTTDPPATEPRAGHTPSTEGIEKYSNARAPCRLTPALSSANDRLTTPAFSELGALHVTADALTTVADATVTPNMQLTPIEAPSSSVPATCRVSSVPPEVGPALGATDHTDPAAMYSYRARPASSSTPLLLTETLTAPDSRAGAVQTSVVEDKYMPLTTVVSPNLHPSSAVCSKPRPSTVTTCPLDPLSPCEGCRDSTVAGALYTNSRPSVVKSTPPLTLTSTATVPAAPLMGVATEMRVEETIFTSDPDTNVPPIRHCTSSARNPLPLKLTTVPPDSAPREGQICSTRGRS